MQSLGILPWGAGGHYSKADKITKWNSLDPTRVQNRARPPCALVQASPRVSRGQLGRESRGRDRRAQEPVAQAASAHATGTINKNAPTARPLSSESLQAVGAHSGEIAAA